MMEKATAKPSCAERETGPSSASSSRTGTGGAALQELGFNQGARAWDLHHCCPWHPQPCPGLPRKPILPASCLHPLHFSYGFANSPLHSPTSLPFSLLPQGFCLNPGSCSCVSCFRCCRLAGGRSLTQITGKKSVATADSSPLGAT